MEDWRHGGFGLYLHWPFCQSKCPYCDFNSHVVDQIDPGRWKDAYLFEIRRAGAETEGRTLDTVFFGGGTPSLMSPDLVSGILDEVCRVWRTSKSLEVTLEANPSSVEAGKFAEFRQAGVNRVSVGVQALNDRDLKLLGRLHSSAEAESALEIARSVFDRVSFDLIYARQFQTLASWERELKRALALADDHLSLYQLTIEEGTTFGRLFSAGKLRGLPEEDLAVDMYLQTQQICSDKGLFNYEVSNFARPGAESRHNLTYWRCGDFLGIGPGAHGRLTLNGARWGYECYKSPSEWLKNVITNGNGEKSRSPVPVSEQAEELLLMGLRLEEGVSLTRLGALHGPQLNTKELLDLNLITVDDDSLRTTSQGRLLLNSVLEKLTAEI